MYTKSTHGFNLPGYEYQSDDIEQYDSYTRAGEFIMVDGILYIIESTNHSIKNGWHFNYSFNNLRCG